MPHPSAECIIRDTMRPVRKPTGRSKRPTLCTKCGEPFVARHYRALPRQSVVATTEVCPDCRREFVRPDLCDVLSRNVGARLARGFEMLGVE